MNSDAEKLEFALQALRTIADLTESSDPDETAERLCAASSLAHSTVLAITRAKEPATDLNDLLMELHEER